MSSASLSSIESECRTRGRADDAVVHQSCALLGRSHRDTPCRLRGARAAADVHARDGPVDVLRDVAVAARARLLAKAPYMLAASAVSGIGRRGLSRRLSR